MIEDDPFYYVGPRKRQIGYVAAELAALDHGPFRYRVRAIPATIDMYFSYAVKPVETFYYLTWTGFLSEWKRENCGKEKRWV